MDAPDPAPETVRVMAGGRAVPVDLPVAPPNPGGIWHLQTAPFCGPDIVPGPLDWQTHSSHPAFHALTVAARAFAVARPLERTRLVVRTDAYLPVPLSSLPAPDRAASPTAYCPWHLYARDARELCWRWVEGYDTEFAAEIGEMQWVTVRREETLIVPAEAVAPPSGRKEAEPCA